MPGDASLRVLLARSPLVGRESLTFVAGRVEATAAAMVPLLTWMRGIPVRGQDAGRWWRCAEWTDRMRLDEVREPEVDDFPRLVWARWFGEAGDLELWREGEHFRWRFLGAPGHEPPAEVAHEDFFADGSGDAPRLRQGEERVALFWKTTDARIATADRDTTAYLRDAPGRLRARFRPYYDHGVLAAVRYLEVVPEDPQPERRR